MRDGALFYTAGEYEIFERAPICVAKFVREIIIPTVDQIAARGSVSRIVCRVCFKGRGSTGAITRAAQQLDIIVIVIKLLRPASPVGALRKLVVIVVHINLQCDLKLVQIVQASDAFTRLLCAA